jgi:tetratricopeptide (TPR) repeat protein
VPTKEPFAILIGAGMRLLQTGNVGAAEQLFQQAIARDSRSPVGYYDLGVAYQSDGKTRLAARQYVRAIAEDPHYVPALYNQAGIVAKRNRRLAIFYYRRVIQLKPNSPTAFLNLGLLEHETKSLRTIGLSHLERAVKLDPSLRAAVPAALRARLHHSGSR